MSGNQVRQGNGQLWTAQQFLDHYLSAHIPGAPTPAPNRPAPVVVDRPWYVNEGPGRYYHPGMFPIVTDIIDRRDLPPGTYNLWDLAPKHEKDDWVKASISHYFTDLLDRYGRTRCEVSFIREQKRSQQRHRQLDCRDSRRRPGESHATGAPTGRWTSRPCQ
jgi:hypothetical protein